MKQVVGSNVQTKPELSEFSEIIGGALFSTSSQLRWLFWTGRWLFWTGRLLAVGLGGSSGTWNSGDQLSWQALRFCPAWALPPAQESDKQVHKKHSWPQDFFFMQKYSNQGISCKYIQIRVFYAEILVRYRYALPSHARLTIWIGHGCNVYSFSGSIDQ